IDQVSRRRFLQRPLVTAAAGLLGGGLSSSVAFADPITLKQRDMMTPESILSDMKRGNQRFRKGETKMRDYLAEQRASAQAQFPAAILLTCIDSRAPAEVILDQGIGDILNSRVAGNIANDDILGSMEFACKITGAK